MSTLKKVMEKIFDASSYWWKWRHSKKVWKTA